MTDTAKCPKCGATVYMPVKSWDVKPKRGGATFHVSLYECPKCLKRWRERRRLNARPSS